MEIAILTTVLYHTTNCTMTYRICTLWGGTGQATILKALSTLPDIELTGIVATTDNGWSSAVLREALHIPSPGDIRNCINHLAPTDDVFAKLLQYRFSEGDLQWVQLGNMIIGALTRILWSYSDAITWLHTQLWISHTILPVSDVSTQICAELTTGQRIVGERQIIKRQNPAKIARYYLADTAPAQLHVVEALRNADCIVICPGVLGTAIISTLLHDGVAEAILYNKGKLVYFCNIMTYPSQTDDFTVSDHVQLLEQYTRRRIDIVYANTTTPPQQLLTQYATYGSVPVRIDREHLADYTLVEDGFLMDYTTPNESLELNRAASAKQHVGLHVIRHNSETIVSHISNLMQS